MDKPQQLSLQSVLSKFLLIVIAHIGGWYMKKYGVDLSPHLAILQHDLVPLIVPALALSVTSWWDHSKIKAASLKIDTALSLPAGTTNAQLNDVISKAVEQAKKSGQDPRDVVQDVTQGIKK